MTSSIYTCDVCHKSYSSKSSLRSHKNWHNPDYVLVSKKAATKGRDAMNKNQTHNNLRSKRISEYNSNPKKCKECKEPLPYDSKQNKFCNHSCAASYQNKHGTFTKRGPSKSKPIKYPSTKVEPKICDITGKVWWYNARHARLSPYRKTIKEQYYSKCAFKFNVYNYPDLFNLSLIEKHGWYTCPGKKRPSIKKNINGVSRDHKISIKEAFDNNYDPYYISHIMNCDLVLHSENKKKQSKSSITYEELIILVNNYDSNL